MRVWLIVAALLSATPAIALPPVMPKTQVVQQLMAAMRANDHAAYAKLFSTGATVTVDGRTFDRQQWLERTKTEFTVTRSTRFLGGLAGRYYEGGQFLILERVVDCRPPPDAVECSAYYRSEMVTLTDDGTHVQTLALSTFNFALSAEGIADTD